MYAFNTKEERKSLWNYLNQIGRGCVEPWLLLGEFNPVLHQDHKIGRNPITLCEVVDVWKNVSCMNNLARLSLHLIDKHNTNRVYFKIDWVFVNEEW